VPSRTRGPKPCRPGLPTPELTGSPSMSTNILVANAETAALVAAVEYFDLTQQDASEHYQMIAGAKLIRALQNLPPDHPVRLRYSQHVLIMRRRLPDDVQPASGGQPIQFKLTSDGLTKAGAPRPCLFTQPNSGPVGQRSAHASARQRLLCVRVVASCLRAKRAISRKLRCFSRAARDGDGSHMTACWSKLNSNFRAVSRRHCAEPWRP
jgi:hypothetical protein